MMHWHESSRDGLSWSSFNKLRFGAVFSYFIEGYRADGAKLFIWAHSEKTKSHVDKLQHEKMPIRDKEKKNLHLIAQRVRGEHPQRCSEADCTRPRAARAILTSLEQEFGLGHLQRVFPAYKFCVVCSSSLKCNVWGNIVEILYREKI